MFEALAVMILLLDLAGHIAGSTTVIVQYDVQEAPLCGPWVVAGGQPHADPLLNYG